MGSLVLERCLSAETPFELGIGNRKNIEYFEIGGCYERFCVLTERTNTFIAIRLKMRKFYRNEKKIFRNI